MRCHWKISQPNRVIANPCIWIDSFVYVGHHSPNMTSNWHPHNGYWCTSHTLSRKKDKETYRIFSNIGPISIIIVVYQQYFRESIPFHFSKTCLFDFQGIFEYLQSILEFFLFYHSVHFSPIGEICYSKAHQYCR